MVGHEDKPSTQQVTSRDRQNTGDPGVLALSLQVPKITCIQTFWPDKKLLSQPLDILPGDPPGPSDLVRRDSFGPKAPVDRLRVHSKFLCELIDSEIIFFHTFPLHIMIILLYYVL